LSSLAHHLDAERRWYNLCHVPCQTAPGSDGQTVDEVKQEFGAWSEATLRAVHPQGYRPPPVRRTSIPKPGQREPRPLGLPCGGDRILQRRVADVLSAIYEQDVLPGSFGGRPGIGAHHALATLHEVIAGKPVSWVYEADLRAFLRKAREQGKRPEAFAFLGLTHDCMRNHQGHFKVGWKTDKTRLRRSLAHLHQLLQRIRHEPLKAQVAQLNQALRGHYAYDGVAGHLRSLQRLDANVERSWRRLLSRRSRTGLIRWDTFQQITRAYPLQRPKLFLPYTRIKSSAVLSSHG
jgi:hypothetical protein